MKNFDPVGLAESGWNPAGLAYILDFQWSTDEGDSCLRIVALLQPHQAGKSWPDDNGPWFRAVIEFHSVRNLRISALGREPWQIVGFAIDDIRDRGLEGISYHVYDYENGALEFYARKMVLLSHESDGGERLNGWTRLS